jgi:hypothetical protein
MRAMLVRVVSVLYGLHQIIEKVRKDYVRIEQPINLFKNYL